MTGVTKRVLVLFPLDVRWPILGEGYLGKTLYNHIQRQIYLSETAILEATLRCPNVARTVVLSALVCLARHRQRG